MYLYKLLAFLDFESMKEIGTPSLGLTYKALEMGPVPDELYNSEEFDKSELYSIRIDGPKVMYHSTSKSPDLDYFSRFEIDEMNRLIEIYADRYVKASDISEASHQDILAWRRTFRDNKYGIIPFEKEFPGDVFSKTTLSPAEENFLRLKAVRDKAHACG